MGQSVAEAMWVWPQNRSPSRRLMELAFSSTSIGNAAPAPSMPERVTGGHIPGWHLGPACPHPTPTPSSPQHCFH